MATFVAATVGTSILANAAREGLGVPEGADRLAPDDPRQGQLEGLPDEVVRRVAQWASREPERASAEANTIYKLFRRWSFLRSGEVELRFYVTDTGAGRAAGRILDHVDWEAVTGARVVRHDHVAVPGFGRDFAEGLANLTRTLGSDLAREKAAGKWVYLVATGGYKPETAYAALAAFMAGADGVAYVHEAFRDVVLLPPLPLRLGEDLCRAASGGLEVSLLARRMGRDVHHLEAVGLLRGGRLAPWISALAQLGCRP